MIGFRKACPIGNTLTPGEKCCEIEICRYINLLRMSTGGKFKIKTMNKNKMNRNYLFGTNCIYFNI